MKKARIIDPISGMVKIIFSLWEIIYFKVGLNLVKFSDSTLKSMAKY
jgi:hypothetical protein